MPQDNRIIIAIGAGLAVLAAVVLALIFGGGRDRPAAALPEAQGAGLTVDLADAPNLDPARELDCYVNGQSVGKATLSDCARRNGVATDALDVGIDQSGATVAFRPPPGPPALEEPVVDEGAIPVEDGPEYAETPREPVQAGGTCMRHTGSEWRTLSSNMSLNACVQALYSGTCVAPGEARYGRWGDTTLRLVPRRVEQSNDDTRFQTLTGQDRSCQFPDLR